MARYEVRCEVEVPDKLSATDEEVVDWVRFNLGAIGSLGPSPLQHRDFQAVPFSVEVTRTRIRGERVSGEKPQGFAPDSNNPKQTNLES